MLLKIPIRTSAMKTIIVLNWNRSALWRIPGFWILMIMLGCGVWRLDAQSVTAELTFPAVESRLSGTINVRGTASTSGAFGGGSLDIIPGGQSAKNLRTLTSSVQNGVLFSGLNTAEYPDGFYVLKLTVFDVSGTPSFDEVSFFIDNTSPSMAGALEINHLLYGNAIIPRGSSVGIYGTATERGEVIDARWVSGSGSTIETVDAQTFALTDREVNAFLPLPSGSASTVRFELRIWDGAGNASDWLRSNEIEVRDQGADPFIRPSFESMLLPNDHQAIEFEGLVYDFRDVFDELLWRRPGDGSEWKTASVTPAWNGWRWSFGWPVASVLSADFAVKAVDRFGNEFGPAVTTVQLASHPFLDRNFPVAELIAPFGVLYQDAGEVVIEGTVQNRPGQSGYSWDLEYQQGDGSGGSWTVVTSDATAELAGGELGRINTPSVEGLYTFRLKARNGYGGAETFRRVYVSGLSAPDSDGDGLSDKLEYEWFGGLGEDFDSDYDGDGLSNGKEIELGFDPTDAGSRLRVISLVEDGQARMMWENSGALRYEVYRRERMEEGAWEKVEELEPGVGKLMEYVVSVEAGVGSMYYRVVEVPDPLAELKTLDLGNGVELEMVVIEAGEFMMGSPYDEKYGGGNERPLTHVKITEQFLLGKYEVTQEQWEAVMGNNPSHFKSSGLKAPVEMVSWHDAVAFCEELNERFAGILPNGYEFGLPSEAQWEYACRAGSQTRFWYGDDLDYEQLHLYANYCDQKCPNIWRNPDANDGYEHTAPVGTYLPNPWGLYDMHGNVLELCRDWYGNYPGGSVEDWVQPQAGSLRVLRGGESGLNGGRCRSASRYADTPSFSINAIGFRLAAVPVP